MNKKIIVVVAFSDSIHTSRWLSNIDKEQFDVHLFPSVPFTNIHPLIKDVTIHNLSFEKNLSGAVNIVASYLPYKWIERILSRKWSRKIVSMYNLQQVQARALKSVISSVQPDIIHTMETQRAGYLMSHVVTRMRTRNFRWIHSTWGIDLHYFQHFAEHLLKIRAMFTGVQLLICEGERDVQIAEKIGFKGKTEIIPSVGGALDFNLFDSLPHDKLVSERTKVILKGYEGHERLASAALTALRKIKHLLVNYTVVVYSCSDKLLPLINEIKTNNEFKLEFSKEMSYTQLLDLTCEARISITNNLSDGVPNTMLESMALGAFPIQSNTAITNGWINNGETGFITDPNDSSNIADAISKALTDNDLVDAAAIRNKTLVREKLNEKRIKKQIQNIYSPSSF